MDQSFQEPQVKPLAGSENESFTVLDIPKNGEYNHHRYYNVIFFTTIIPTILLYKQVRFSNDKKALRSLFFDNL